MLKYLVATLVLGFCMGCASSGTAPADSTDNGKLSEGCHTPLGFIPEGHTANGYLHQIESGQMRCQQGTLSCEDGVWSGAYIYPSCVQGQP